MGTFVTAHVSVSGELAFPLLLFFPLLFLPLLFLLLLIALLLLLPPLFIPACAPGFLKNHGHPLFSFHASEQAPQSPTLAPLLERHLKAPLRKLGFIS